VLDLPPPPWLFSPTRRDNAAFLFTARPAAGLCALDVAEGDEAFGGWLYAGEPKRVELPSKPLRGRSAKDFDRTQRRIVAVLPMVLLDHVDDANTVVLRTRTPPVEKGHPRREGIGILRSCVLRPMPESDRFRVR